MPKKSAPTVTKAKQPAAVQQGKKSHDKQIRPAKQKRYKGGKNQQSAAEPEVEVVQEVTPEEPKEEVPVRTPQEVITSIFSVKGVSFTMCYVQGGTFMMGATPEQGEEVSDDEKPAHEVTVSSFYIGQTEVTQALWKAVMGKKPSKFKGDNLPVEQISWNDCQTFIEKLNFMTGRTFRLPTEAEWEFAARGGNNSKDCMFSGSNYPDDVAWHSGNANAKTHMVGTKQANELGIYDMCGNVSEWCADWYDDAYYQSNDSQDPRGPISGSSRVVRGGSWSGNLKGCRVAFRFNGAQNEMNNSLGFRLVITEW